MWVADDNVFMVHLAKKYKALTVALEHRFYGKSQPMPDWTVESLRVLAMRQAVDDVTTFQDHLVQSRNLVAAKWINFGGSFPGQLATYTKLFYPD
ncbi:Aste57867_10031 [Aphanomyces stellatus]|uniref:Aste57867_10031 protein n=1 Tax=Aphanomyces stellatus TaxID=120398 RepID=A0A485KPT2_9STRA|nr:hypothetical protein As57867_009992 [Aphanomyces stellatus]VFT86908.1 Aste57867_10031 [Aphanomyces stellatus]